ncbi:hypothetical protein Tco_0233665 [Tanacetum coccineum]
MEVMQHYGRFRNAALREAGQKWGIRYEMERKGFMMLILMLKVQRLLNFEKLLARNLSRIPVTFHAKGWQVIEASSLVGTAEGMVVAALVRVDYSDFVAIQAAEVRPGGVAAAAKSAATRNARVTQVEIRQLFLIDKRANAAAITTSTYALAQAHKRVKEVLLYYNKYTSSTLIVEKETNGSCYMTETIRYVRIIIVVGVSGGIGGRVWWWRWSLAVGCRGLVDGSVGGGQ